MLYIDTNYLIRFLTNDIPSLALKAKEVINNNQIFITGVILAETVYILRKFYEIDKLEVCLKMDTFLRQKNVSSPNYSLLSIKIYKSENVSFYDSLLVAEVIETNNQMATFDVKLQKIFKKYASN